MQILHKVRRLPNCVKFLASAETADEYAIFIELAAYSFVRLAEIRLTEQQVSYQLLLGVSSLHDINIIHRDLKPDNILIRFNGSIAIADFGLSVDDDGNKHAGKFLNKVKYCQFSPYKIFFFQNLFKIKHVWNLLKSWLIFVRQLLKI